MSHCLYPDHGPACDLPSIGQLKIFRGNIHLPASAGTIGLSRDHAPILDGHGLGRDIRIATWTTALRIGEDPATGAIDQHGSRRARRTLDVDRSAWAGRVGRLTSPGIPAYDASAFELSPVRELKIVRHNIQLSAVARADGLCV